MTKPSTRSLRSTPRTITPELVCDALASIPPDVDRDTWARLGMAIKSELPDTVGFDLWNDWSARGATYNERNARDTWRSIKASGKTSIGTLFGVAKDHGYKLPKADASIAVQTPAQADATQAAAARLADERRHKQAAESAEYSRKLTHSERGLGSFTRRIALILSVPVCGCGYANSAGRRRLEGAT